MEQLLTDGTGQRSLSSSQRRSVSPSTSDELGNSGSSSSSRASSPAPSGSGNSAAATAASRTTGPQTGVKGVRADAKYVAQHERQQRADEVHATNVRMQAMALGKSRTWKEDDEERKGEAELAASRQPGMTTQTSASEEDDDDEDFDEEAELEFIRQRRLQTIKSQEAANESRRRRMAGEDGDHRPNSRGVLTTTNSYKSSRSVFGHLREVGPDQYTQAIDSVDASTYVVVHIYVKYVHACAQLTSSLSSLARMHTGTKFLQIRAGSIGFGSNGAADADAAEDDLDDAAEEVVPTLLVYKAGKVVANLVRVDLDEGWGGGSERCVRDILLAHDALH